MMGRLQRIRKKRHRRQHCPAAELRPRAFGSDPEACRVTYTLGEEQFSSSGGTNSCDDSNTSYHHHCVNCPTIYPQHHCPDCVNCPTTYEMEVTHKLSCLNFSVLPCTPNTLAVNPGASVTPSGMVPLIRDFEVSSDLEVCSEMASATQLDLLPTLSDKEMEGVESCQRHARKRPAKRKTNRRTKKFRSINSRGITGETSVPKAPKYLSSGASSAQQLLFIKTARDTPTSPHRSMRGRSCRRGKLNGRIRHEEEDSFLSDTSVLDIMELQGKDVDEVESMFETTPPVMESEQMGNEVLVIESDLSETTSDSGCEGDDEESSVEGPTTTLLSRDAILFPGPGFRDTPRPRLGTTPRNWWDKAEDLPSTDSKFQQILDGSFPLLSAEGRHKMEQICSSPSSPFLPEFKHPGHLKPCGERSGRKKRCKPQELTSPLTLREINQKILHFVQEPAIDNAELKFAFVSRALCKTIASLAAIYQLECSIEHKRRLPVASPRLRKTNFTRLASKEEVQPVLMRHGRESPGIGLSLKAGSQSRSLIHTSESHSKTPIQVVGSGAQALDETNIGNQMLQGMGWRPGTGLGPECDGIRSPVRAYLRTKHLGLGCS